jgi:hypothetical protein
MTQPAPSPAGDRGLGGTGDQPARHRLGIAPTSFV